ncbi:MAG: antitoxin Xre-like helix-turn-helix domain-containing protein [Cyanobacteria bacterium J06600_6]
MIYETVGKVLKLGSQPSSLQDLRAITHQGLPKVAVDEVKKLLDLSTEELAKYLHLSVRTLQRYNDTKILSADASDRLIQIAKVYARAWEVFEDESLAIAWLKSPSLALGNQIPQEYLDNFSGMEIVLDELNRIEYGVFA